MMAKKIRKPRTLAERDMQAHDDAQWLFVAATRHLANEEVDLNVDSLDAGSRLRWQSRNQCLPSEAIVTEGLSSFTVELFGKRINFIPDDKQELDYLKSKMKK